VRVGEHPKQIGLAQPLARTRRSEHLHAGTHPKQIGLAQPLARDAHGDAPDELWLESMAYLWGEGRCSEHLHAGRPDELWLESMAYL